MTNENSKIMSDASPWWLVRTEIGKIVIGWRKRVIVVDWSDTSIRGIVTKHETTKSDSAVHAWCHADAVAYLVELKNMFMRINK